MKRFTILTPLSFKTKSMLSVFSSLLKTKFVLSTENVGLPSAVSVPLGPIKPLRATYVLSLLFCKIGKGRPPSSSFLSKCFKSRPLTISPPVGSMTISITSFLAVMKFVVEEGSAKSKITDDLGADSNWGNSSLF